MVDLYSGSLPSDLICVRDDIPSFVINKVYIYMYLYVERDWTKFNSLGKGVDWKSSFVISLSPPGLRVIKWRIKRKRDKLRRKCLTMVIEIMYSSSLFFMRVSFFLTIYKIYNS